MFENNTIYPENKKECYELILKQLNALLENERNLIPNLANSSALLGMALRDINWAGFYLMKNGELLLGPFQGKPACVHIPVGKGVCGTAVSEGKTQLVPDVHKFEGHIACDSASRSEIVVPIYAGGVIKGVLDIDSPLPGRFDSLDQHYLEEFVRILEASCDWD
ncbi:MAG: GAF domain-containing protein [Clostridiales bacterium]|nr:GAF domain-containing protein [Clostridiales bacterium]